jgi:hypothetical protein
MEDGLPNASGELSGAATVWAGCLIVTMPWEKLGERLCDPTQPSLAASFPMPRPWRRSLCQARPCPMRHRGPRGPASVRGFACLSRHGVLQGRSGPQGGQPPPWRTPPWFFASPAGACPRSPTLIPIWSYPRSCSNRSWKAPPRQAICRLRARCSRLAGWKSPVRTRDAQSRWGDSRRCRSDPSLACA